jgi:hypothetical protein
MVVNEGNREQEVGSGENKSIGDTPIGEVPLHRSAALTGEWKELSTSYTL